MTPAEEVAHAASMGPRRRRRGRGGAFNGTTALPWSLQWGHVVVDVEGTEGRVGGRRVRRASMGPRRRRRGRANAANADASSSNKGFNGATSSSTWKARAEKVEADLIVMLQWGHVVVDVEGREEATQGRRDEVALQWGHVVVDVEVTAVPTRPGSS